MRRYVVDVYVQRKRTTCVTMTTTVNPHLQTVSDPAAVLNECVCNTKIEKFNENIKEKHFVFSKHYSSLDTPLVSLTPVSVELTFSGGRVLAETLPVETKHAATRSRRKRPALMRLRAAETR